MCMHALGSYKLSVLHGGPILASIAIAIRLLNLISRTIFGKRGPLLVADIGPGGPILAAKIGPGD